MDSYGSKCDKTVVMPSHMLICCACANYLCIHIYLYVSVCLCIYIRICIFMHTRVHILLKYRRVTALGF